MATGLQELFPPNSTSVLEMVNAAETNISQSSVEYVATCECNEAKENLYDNRLFLFV